MANWQESVKEFFNRVGEYLRRGSEKAGEWIDEQAAITRRVRAIRKLRAQQREILEIIGSKVYTLHTRGKVRNKDILAECRRVDEILAHIERLRREIEEIKQKSRHPQVKLMEVEDEAPIGDEDEGAEAPAEQQPAQGETAETPQAPGEPTSDADQQQAETAGAPSGTGEQAEQAESQQPEIEFIEPAGSDQTPEEPKGPEQQP